MVACGCARRSAALLLRCASPPPPGRGVAAPLGRPPSRSSFARSALADPPEARGRSSSRPSPPSPAQPPPGATRPPSGKLPAFDYTALVASVSEIRAHALPTKVEVAVQPDAFTLVLGLRGLDGKRALHVSWHSDAARACLGPSPPRVHKSENLSFGEQCQANLRGLILVAAAVPTPWERVAILDFAERPGAPPRFRLHVETQGRNSNAVLAEADPERPTIVACAYQVGAAQTSVRPLSPGFQYRPPPVAPGVAPDDPTVAEEAEWRRVVLRAAAGDEQEEEEGEEENRRDPKKKNPKASTKSPRKPSKKTHTTKPATAALGLVRGFRGVSPALAGALAADAGVEPGALAADLSDDRWAALHAEWTAWVDATRSARRLREEPPASSDEPASDFEPAVSFGWVASHGQLLIGRASDGPGSSREGGFAPLGTEWSDLVDASGTTGVDSGQQHCPTPPVGALFARVYGEESDADVFRREKDRLAKAAATAERKTRQKLTAFARQIADGEAHEATKLRADEIMAYLHAYEDGAAELEVFDFETGEAKKAAIDPVKGANATAEALYKRARKQRRTADAVAPLLERAERELEYLEQVAFQLEELTGDGGRDDVLALEEIANELVDAKLAAPAGKGAAKRIREEERRARGGGGKKGGGGVARGGGKRRAKAEAMANVRTYVAPSGKEVLVGRNSKGNEAVSLKIGQNQDVWFHVRGAPGAHVILRQQPGETASAEDMTFAADLAAFHSKLRTGGNVDVSFTSPKHVRKPAGARLGMVTIGEESVMNGAPDRSVAAEEERKRGGAEGGRGGW